MKILTRSDLQKCLSMRDAIEAMREAFAQVTSGAANVPLRVGLPAGDGVSLFMPAHLRDSHAMGLKIVSVHTGNGARGLPTILALVALVDTETGAPLALMEGAYLTSMRTAAGSGLATEYLARPDASIAAIIGAGAQGRAHALAMCTVRPIKELRVLDSYAPSAQALAVEVRAQSGVTVRIVSSAQEAVAGADIICCCTTSPTPVFDGRDLKPGAHINAIGAYTPDTRETDDETMRRVSRIVVDSRATVAHEAGDLVIPIKNGVIREIDITAELGELVLGQKSGRPSTGSTSSPTGSGRDEITLFKAVGNAAQDVAAATAALNAALRMGLGVEVDLQG
ncbi:MAG: ornithine cyclodeaminase family protein [Chloroflexi bacterium]|nr:ornithine cyclodeaminase family protein [Chloroflexota bacterium]